MSCSILTTAILLIPVLLQAQTGQTQSLRATSPSPLEAEYRKARATLPPHFAVCFPTKKVSCGDGSCMPLKPITVFYLLGKNPRSRTFSRCDPKGCDTYEVEVNQSGAFETMHTDEPRGQFFKRTVVDLGELGPPLNQFVEVASIWLEVLVSTGYCRNVGE